MVLLPAPIGPTKKILRFSAIAIILNLCRRKECDLLENKKRPQAMIHVVV